MNWPRSVLEARWMDKAACKGMPAGFHGSVPRWKEIATRVCGACPVEDECLAYALMMEYITNNDGSTHRSGLWGGTSAAERERLWREDPGLVAGLVREARAA